MVGSVSEGPYSLHSLPVYANTAERRLKNVSVRITEELCM